MASTTSRNALATTPPPPSSLRTPPTPKHAGDYEPYSPPRKSIRISSQRAQRQAQTPPPPAARNYRATQPSSPPSTTKQGISSSTPNSPPLTIAKKRVAASKDSRRVSGSLTEGTMASAATALGLPATSKVSKGSTSRPVIGRNILPTPDKTPKKRPNKPAAGISSIARNLFPVRPETVDEVMPSPKKHNKKYTGFTLDSFGADETDEPIAIFTDSHERIPEVDNSEENPFYNPTAAVPEPTKKGSKRRKVVVPGEGEQSLEDAEKREDGLVYVFRGKKFFRKFADDKSKGQAIDADDELDDDLELTVSPRLRGSLTRSSIKPRLLFPVVTKSVEDPLLSIPDEDEEAVTDIDEALVGITTPSELTDERIATPKAPRFAPTSPPTSGRATRSKKVGSSSPAAPSSDSDHANGGSKVSPFYSWQRTKAPSLSVASKKRDGSPGLAIEMPSKRRRGQVSS